MRMRALDPIPATRFNLNQVVDNVTESSHLIVKMAKDHQPFKEREESFVWYDRIPHLRKNQREEKHLLASITFAAIPEERKCEIEGSLDNADILASSGKITESIAEINKVYDSCIRILT